jgi:UbiD family decarboxylase
LTDLRSFIAHLQENHPHHLQIVEEPVNLHYELNAIAFEYGKRDSACLFFKKVRGVPFPHVVNLFGSRERIALALNLPAEKIYDLLPGRMDRKIAPERVAEGPVKEVKRVGTEVDMEDLPLPRFFQEDGGRYITAGLVVARDPEDPGLTNLTFARIQLKGKNRMGISLHSRGYQFHYLQKAREMGKPLQVAVVVGAHPALYLAAGARITGEYEVTGSLMDQPLKLIPCETVDVDVPFDAEFVIEGEISTEVEEDEGPFSEYLGYLSGRSTRNILTVKAVTHRKDGYFLSILPSYSAEHILLSNITREARSYRTLKSYLPVAGVRSINWPILGVRLACFLSLDRPLPGVAKQAALNLLGSDLYLKMVAVTNQSVNPHNFEEVLGAIAASVRCNGGRDVDIINGVFCNLLDPSSSREGTSSKVIFDATSDENPQTSRCDDAEILAAVRKGFPQIEELHFPEVCKGWVAYLKASAVSARQLGEKLFEHAPGCSLVIVLDADINLKVGEEILWSLASRMQPHRDITLLPSSETTRIIIDARKASDFHALRPTLPPEVESKAKKTVDELLG